MVDAVAAVDRALFVPPGLEDRAWEDGPLPIGNDQTISQPYVVARMCELLALAGDEHVLDVGTGSGYHAAVLSRLARDVVSIERHPALSAAAEEALGRAGIRNVRLVVGDGALGVPEDAPYDAINVAATARELPPPLVAQLARGGRLVAPVGRRRQRLCVVARDADGVVTERWEDEVRFVPLVSAAAASRSPAARGRRG